MNGSDEVARRRHPNDVRPLNLYTWDNWSRSRRSHARQSGLPSTSSLHETESHTGGAELPAAADERDNCRSHRICAVEQHRACSEGVFDTMVPIMRTLRIHPASVSQRGCAALSVSIAVCTVAVLFAWSAMPHAFGAVTLDGTLYIVGAIGGYEMETPMIWKWADTSLVPVLATP
jgi:hypothetical protein